MYGLQSIFQEKGFIEELQLYILRVLSLADCFSKKVLINDLKQAKFEEGEINDLLKIATYTPSSSLSIDEIIKYRFVNLLNKTQSATDEQLKKTLQWLSIVITREFTAKSIRNDHEHLAQLLKKNLTTPQQKKYRDIILFADNEKEAFESIQYLQENLILENTLTLFQLILVCAESEKNKFDLHQSDQSLKDYIKNLKKPELAIFFSRYEDINLAAVECFNSEAYKTFLSNNNPFLAFLPQSTLFVIHPDHLARDIQQIPILLQKLSNLFDHSSEIICATNSLSLLHFHEYLFQVFLPNLPEKNNLVSTETQPSNPTINIEKPDEIQSETTNTTSKKSWSKLYTYGSLAAATAFVFWQGARRGASSDLTNVVSDVLNYASSFVRK